MLMNDEIKEILGMLNFNRDTISNGTCRIEDLISREQIIKLLDYITKLQEVVYNLTTASANGDRTQIKNTAQYKLELAQQRIDKAIDYIGANKKIIEFGYSAKLECNAYELLDILRSEDNE